MNAAFLMLANAVVGFSSCLSQSGEAAVEVQPSREPAAMRGVEPDEDGQIFAYVRKVFQSRDGHLWFGGNDGGVGRFDGKALTFYGPREGLAGRAVRGIVQDDAGAVWIASDGGVSKYQQGAFTTFTLGDGAPGNEAWCLFLDKSGTLWVGALAGVRRFDGEAFVPFALPQAKAPIPRSLVGPAVVLDMTQDQRGDIWFATDGAGLYKYDGKSFVNHTTADGLESNQILCVHADRRGRLWAGTEGGGVTRIDGATVRTYSTKDGLGNDRVWDILEDRRGDMWFATLGAGVTRFDGTRFAVFGPTHGLTAGHVQHLLEDRDGTLWLGCSGGLFRREGERFVNVTRHGPWKGEPLAAFSRLTGGRWKMTTAAGRDNYDTWPWGPGRQSIRSMRAGALMDGDPWLTMTVYYWHPTLQEVRLLSVGSVMRGVGEGRITFEGDRAESVYVLNQTGGPRNLRERWTFAGTDQLHDELSERARGDYELLAEWDRVRVDAAAPAEPAAGPLLAPGGTPSELMRPIEKVLGQAWASIAADGADATRRADETRTRTTFEYWPHADAIYGRVAVIGVDGVSSHAMDVYLYHHTGTRGLRCLALTSHGLGDASVYEGAIVPAGDGRSFTIRLTAHGSSGEQALEARIEFGDGDVAHGRIWRSHDREPALMDRRFQRVKEQSARATQPPTARTGLALERVLALAGLELPWRSRHGVSPAPSPNALREQLH